MKNSSRNFIKNKIYNDINYEVENNSMHETRLLSCVVHCNVIHTLSHLNCNKCTVKLLMFITTEFLRGFPLSL